MNGLPSQGRTPTAEELALLDKVIEWEIRARARHVRGADREDLKQELWIKVIQAFQEFDPARSGLKTYMNTVVANAILDQLKSGRRRRQHEEAHASDVQARHASLSTDKLTNIDAKQDIAAVVSQAVESHRLLLHLVMESGSVSEAARLMDLKDGKARYHLKPFADPLR